MEASGQRLGRVVNGRILYGAKSGLNEAFVIDDAKRAELVARDKRSVEIIKPLVVGDDVRRYEIHYRGTHLIFTRRGVEIDRYPAIAEHLEGFHERLRTAVRWLGRNQAREMAGPETGALPLV